MGDDFMNIRFDIELQGARVAVMRAITERQDEVKKSLDAALTQAIEATDFTTIVREQARTVLADVVKKAVADYFKYGEGQNAVKQAINGVLSK